MTTTGHSTFDKALYKANEWLDEIGTRLGWFDRHRSAQAMRAVLHALRDRLSVNQAAAFAAQLPLLVRGLFYEGWHPQDKPLRERTREQFLAHVAQELTDAQVVDIEEMTNVVFAVVSTHVSPGEVESIKRSLPDSIRQLWT